MRISLSANIRFMKDYPVIPLLLSNCELKIMIKKFICAAICLISFYGIGNAQVKKLSGYVDPFIGTDGFGHTYPGASLPFGMVQLSPDTRTSGWENCSGYHSSNTTILGFSHTHLSGTGASDYGDIMFMATDGKQVMPGDESDPKSGYRSAFNHESERAKPGYYKVMLADHSIQAEMTATTRCGMQRYVFPPLENPSVILDLVHGISDKVTGSQIIINDNKSISGYRRSSGWAKDHIVYFYAEFSVPFIESGIFNNKGEQLTVNATEDVNGLKSWFKFKLRNYDPVLIKVGISTVSIENAKLNLETEMADWDFESIKNKAAGAWDEELNRIQVEGGTKENKTTFYTSLYHVMLSPNIMSDVDGSYRGMDGNIHKMDRGRMYTVFSLWDTFRALHPLLTIIDPIRAQELVRALIQKYRESGLLPVWELASNETNCMIGYHSVPVIVDAFMKGLRDFDYNFAYEAMRKSAMTDHLGMEYYKKLGYIPADKENESVSKTLEYAYDDWCIAIMAKELGKTDDYEYFMRRSKSYINMYDVQTGFMRGKKNANWVVPFDPYEVSGIYTEANAWQYTWFVPHDVSGMMDMMGGDETFTTRLDSLFSAKTKLSGRSQPDISGMIGQYAHGNEPSHHMIYLYNYTSSPQKTPPLVKNVMQNFYTNSRDGLIGNEDCGQMSAWYVMSAMGFYPVCPGTDTYEFGTPAFSKITINKNKGNRFVISADSLNEQNIFMSEVTLNDKPMKRKLRHNDFKSGGQLNYRMVSEATAVSLHSENTSSSFNMVMSPFLVSGEKAFTDSCRIEMHTYTPGAIIRYTLNGNEPDQQSKIYTLPFYISNSTEIKFKAFADGLKESYTTSASFIKIPYRKTIEYTYPYSHNYTAGGKNGLIDGLHGLPEVFGGWQGFYGTDFEAVVDLGEVRNFNKIETTFLQQYASWIWFPYEVEYYISNDGKNFKQVYSETIPYPVTEPGSFVYAFTSDNLNTSARYIKVVGHNIKTCPDWHPGAGEKAWIFVDEITVD